MGGSSTSIVGLPVRGKRNYIGHNAFVLLLNVTAYMESLNPVFPVVWQNDHLELIDQNRLPDEYDLVRISRSEDLAIAIEDMIVRGASAIGVAAAYGMYLGAREIQATERALFLNRLEAVAQTLRDIHSTAINLSWVIDRMLKAARQTAGDVARIKSVLLETAKQIQNENLQTCYQIGNHGRQALPEMPQKLRLLTHCNAGALATAGYGTALGVVRSAWVDDRLERVYATETRPRFQGARLTAWECVEEGIPVTLITDGMAAHCMQQGMVDAVVVGADCIAANGDVVNKVGTYGLALLAKAHQLPFLVAAPLSTVDFGRATGAQISVKTRDGEEISHIFDRPICPTGTEFYNPASDMTPAELVTTIITEQGAIAPSDLHQLKHPPEK